MALCHSQTQRHMIKNLDFIRDVGVRFQAEYIFSFCPLSLSSHLSNVHSLLGTHSEYPVHILCKLPHELGTGNIGRCTAFPNDPFLFLPFTMCNCVSFSLTLVDAGSFCNTFRNIDTVEWAEIAYDSADCTVTLSALILSGSMPYVCQDICRRFVRI